MLQGSMLPQQQQLQQHHYGVQYLARTWVGLAITRRSFALLSRACALAARYDIGMDQILRPDMTFITTCLLVPAEQQQVLGEEPFQYADNPTALRQATDCPLPDGEGSSDHDLLRGRWIWIREMKEGVTRYFLSKDFGHDIASLEKMNETYRRNEIAVVDLFVHCQTGRSQHIRTLAEQVSWKTSPDTPIKTTRVPNIRLLTKTKGELLVQHVSALHIVNLDTSYMYIEYVLSDDALLLDSLNLQSDSMLDSVIRGGLKDDDFDFLLNLLS
jgi:hypothetical protein